LPHTHATPVVLDVRIDRQPDYQTCGPTCLHAVYRYFGDDISLADVIATSGRLPGDSSGTLAVMLGLHALQRGYDASLYTFNLQIFDPTWFALDDGEGHPEVLSAKLHEQRAIKGADDPKLGVATSAYLEFLQQGGRIYLRDLTSGFIAHFIRSGRPLLTGLSATYLYRCSREFEKVDDYDDVRGGPMGHFVVLHGYDPIRRLVTVADPLEDNPAFAARNYTAPFNRLVASIMLGVLTYDANLLVIEPQEEDVPRAHTS